MRIKITLIILTTAIFLSGCTKEVIEENTSLKEATILLEKHEYLEAKDILLQILETDNQNQNARDMYIQAINMQDAIKYEEYKNYEKAIEELKIVESTKHGSDEIKKEAKNKRKEIEKLNEEYQAIQKKRKETAKVVAANDIHLAEKRALEEQQKLYEENLKKEQDKLQQQQNQENNQNNNQNQSNNIVDDLIDSIIKPQQ